MYKLKKFLDNP